MATLRRLRKQTEPLTLFATLSKRPLAKTLAADGRNVKSIFNEVSKPHFKIYFDVGTSQKTKNIFVDKSCLMSIRWKNLPSTHDTFLVAVKHGSFFIP